MTTVFPNIDAALNAARKEVGSRTIGIHICKGDSDGWIVRIDESTINKRFLP